MATSGVRLPSPPPLSVSLCTARFSSVFPLSPWLPSCPSCPLQLVASDVLRAPLTTACLPLSVCPASCVLVSACSPAFIAASPFSPPHSPLDRAAGLAIASLPRRKPQRERSPREGLAHGCAYTHTHGVGRDHYAGGVAVAVVAVRPPKQTKRLPTPAAAAASLRPCRVCVFAAFLFPPPLSLLSSSAPPFSPLRLFPSPVLFTPHPSSRPLSYFSCLSDFATVRTRAVPRPPPPPSPRRIARVSAPLRFSGTKQGSATLQCNAARQAPPLATQKR